jgi:hypothetical protein
MSRVWSAMHGLLTATARADTSAQRRPAAEDSGHAWQAAPGLTGDPLQTAFEQEFDVWTLWVYTVREEHDCMRRVVRTYRLGWLAVTGTTLAIPWLGAPAAVASVALLFTTLLLAFEHALPRAEQSDRAHGSGTAAVGAEQGRPVFGPDERARLIRIMNLSRSATRPAVRELLRDELRLALSEEPLASWPVLRRLEEAVNANAFA